MRIRPQVLTGEIIIAIIGILLVINGAYEGAIGCAAIIGTTMKEIIADKE